ncbi:MAG: YicC/YloC family endoribonuclease [Planctomycetota bacterium]
MTGHGQATVEREQVRVAVEIRSVNSRYLKTSVHSELGSTAIAKIESLVKQKIHRGTVSVRVKTVYLDDSKLYRLNESAIRQYWLQLTEIAGSSQHVNVEAILQLPGVVDETNLGDVDQSMLEVINDSVGEALDRLNRMRQVEGDAMKVDMMENIGKIDQALAGIKKLAPRVAIQYSERLTERINRMLAEFDVTVSPSDVVKEVGFFADRCDISEETMRLGSHLEQFSVVVEQPTPGKKLDFLVQEMLRETNTIGSKANDSDIARHVVEVKTCIERIREMVQNIE